MHLLYIVSGMNFFSEGYRGRVMHALGICEGFVENGWDVTIIGGNGLKKFKDDMPAKVEIIEVTEPTGYFKYLIWWYRVLYSFLKFNKARITDCLMMRYAFSSYLLMMMIAILSPKHIVKVLEVNSFGYHWLGHLGKWINIAVARFEMCLVNFFTLVYVVSDSMVNDHRNYGCKRKIIAVPNGATTKKINYKYDISDDCVSARLVYLGTLMPYWDFKYLAEAINEFHKNIDNEVVIFGDGPALGEFKSSIINNHLTRFYGQFSRNDLGYLLKPDTDILILPPHTKEDMVRTGGLSTKLFDYLSMKIPILAPSDGEINSVLYDNFNSVLYKSDDIKSFSISAQKLMKNPELRNEIANNAYNDFIDKYSWRARMKKIITEVKKLK